MWKILCRHTFTWIIFLNILTLKLNPSSNIWFWSIYNDLFLLEYSSITPLKYIILVFSFSTRSHYSLLKRCITFTFLSLFLRLFMWLSLFWQLYLEEQRSVLKASASSACCWSLFQLCLFLELNVCNLSNDVVDTSVEALGGQHCKR